MTCHEGTEGGSGLAFTVLDSSAKSVCSQRHARPFYPIRKRPVAIVLEV
jgi:hypothetical protein